MRHGTPLLVENYRAREGDPPLEPPIASLICSPLLRGQRVVGAIVAIRLLGRRAFDHTDVEQLEAYVGHTGVALELNQSHADQEALAVLREHQRIAADLHDHVIQELFATGMALQGMVYRTEDPRDQATLVEFVDAIDATIRRIRTTIFRLNRAPYGGGSLKERLLSVVEDARPALGFTAHAEFSGPLDQAVPDDLADHVVAVAREALSNAARHAGAKSVRLVVTLAEDLLTVDAIDDGRGLGSPTRSSGLANLERRAKESGGTLEILEPAGGGTHLRWTAVVRLA
jgi:signal transduction histidine kinase